YLGPEPDRRWTERGAVLLFVGPLVLLALAAAFAPAGWAAPVAPVSILLGLSLLAYLLVRTTWKGAVPSSDRMTEYASPCLPPPAGGPVPARRLRLPGRAGADRSGPRRGRPVARTGPDYREGCRRRRGPPGPPGGPAPSPGGRRGRSRRGRRAAGGGPAGALL